MDSQIRSLGFVRIRACSKYVYVLRIRQDSLDSWKQVESFENQSTKRIHEMNPRNESFENIKDSWSTIRNKSGFIYHETIRIFLESGFVTTIQNESMDLRNKSTFLRISYTIPASLLILHHLLQSTPIIIQRKVMKKNQTLYQKRFC